jgi:hypothetical protein
MKQNVGDVDKLIRVFIGAIVFGLGFYYSSWWGLLGLIPLLTAVVGFCPLYMLLGISTCKPKK